MTTSSSARPRRLGPRRRKAFLVTHIVSAGAWIGMDIALGILVCTALLTSDPEVTAGSYRVLQLFAGWPMLVASLLCLASGIVLAVGSKYGLFRYWWVFAKLVVNVVMSLLILFVLRPGLNDVAANAQRLAAGDTSLGSPSGLLYPVIVAPGLLLFAFVLSTFKPWGRIRRARRATASDVVEKPLHDGRAVTSKSGA
ncbi:hypothetical protein ACFWY9_16960 [Amycolatopsis sp. NPDC059027]|uniref:hypothetical protein n=1 Tax=unclassified Amycolatopsis TaxID=2618356 RepID=UPI00366EE19F